MTTGQTTTIVRRLMENSSRKRTIELTDDLHQNEPVAWFVLSHNTAEEECRVFASRSDAERYTEHQADDAGCDWLVYPLYATHPTTPTVPMMDYAARIEEALNGDILTPERVLEATALSNQWWQDLNTEIAQWKQSAKTLDRLREEFSISDDDL